MDLVIDKCYLELDKRSNVMNVRGFIYGKGRIESLDVELDGTEPYKFELQIPVFRQLIKEFNGEYYYRKGRKAQGDDIFISLTERLEPRRVTLDSIKRNSPDNGDAINQNALGAYNLFKNAKYLGNYNV